MGEHLLCKQGVIGSIPFTSTISGIGDQRKGRAILALETQARGSDLGKSEQRVLKRVLCVLPLAVEVESVDL